MGKNTLGGKKHKKLKKNTNNIIKRYELNKDEFYAKVIKILGGKLVELELVNSKVSKCIGVLDNTMYKKVWLERNDYVIVKKTEDKKYYNILYKFYETIDFKIDNENDEIEFIYTKNDNEENNEENNENNDGINKYDFEIDIDKI